MSFYIIRFFIRFLIPIITRLEVDGLENIPSTGGCITAGNHLGRLDLFLVYYLLNRRDIILVVAEKYRRFAFIRWLVKSLDAVFIDRYSADLATMRVVLERLRKGGALIIAPEGTRSKTEKLLPGHPGASFLAAKSGVPVIPVGGVGMEDRLVRANLLHFRRSKVILRVGEPFILPPVPREDREAALERYTDEIMCRIAVLLPPEYRGVYADHPRLKELLEEQN
jgi:1-acyl-sn-glycerol-3-phosphate acyltransferase